MKKLIFLLLPLMAMCSCRSHKVVTSSASSELSRHNASVAVEQIKESKDRLINASLSFDSIEVVIERTWPVNTYDSVTDAAASSGRPPVREKINLKGYGPKADVAMNEESSRDYAGTVLQTEDLQEDTQQDSSETAENTGIFEPPNVFEVVMWSFVIGALILVLLCYLKRKTNS